MKEQFRQQVIGILRAQLKYERETEQQNQNIKDEKN